MMLKSIWSNTPLMRKISFDAITIIIAKDEPPIEYFPDAF